MGIGAHPASYPMGAVFFPRSNRSGRHVNHSPPFNAEVKNCWNRTYASVMCFHDVDRDKFAFFFVFTFVRDY
jgi:hypothetical protein